MDSPVEGKTISMSGQAAVRPATDQETFWSRDFGNEYTQRNQVLPTDRAPFFAQVLSHTYGVQRIAELGANKGHNLDALHHLSGNYDLTGVELNPTAYAEMAQKKHIQSIQSAIQDFQPAPESFDLVFTCGVLIHINPDDLPLIYQTMYQSSRRYILINEYFNPSPVELPYRGHAGKLFKRDFAGEFLDQYAGRVSVVQYGFLWRRMDPAWDDTTWVLMEKTR